MTTFPSTAPICEVMTIRRSPVSCNTSPGEFGAWDDFLLNRKVDAYSEATENYEGWRTIGVPLFESEDLTDKLLRIYLSMIPSKGWSGNPQDHLPTGDPMADIGNLYLQGLWLPCTPRMVMAGQIDARNDGLPEWSAIPRFDNGHVSFFTVRKLTTAPRGWGALPGSSAYYMSSWFDPQPPDTKLTGDQKRERGMMRFYSYPISIVNDRVIPMLRGGPVHAVHAASSFALDTAAALTVPADFRSLWNVETEEEVLGKNHRTPLRLGVDAEVVKSLFYARQTPLSESGRKRPILHWVRSHQRRLKAGVDVDVSKHLRGITEFEMDNFPFRITNPQKAIAP